MRHHIRKEGGRDRIGKKMQHHITYTPAPDSPHRAVTLPGGSSRVKSSNTTCRARDDTPHWRKREKLRKEEGEGFHLLWPSGIGKLDIFKLHSSFNLIGWNSGPTPQWDGGVQDHVLKYSCSSSRTSYHLAKQDGESPHGPEGGREEGREGEGRRGKEREEEREEGRRERGKRGESPTVLVYL